MTFKKLKKDINDLKDSINVKTEHKSVFERIEIYTSTLGVFKDY